VLIKIESLEKLIKKRRLIERITIKNKRRDVMTNATEIEI
jgi:hypothetical protein